MEVVGHSARRTTFPRESEHHMNAMDQRTARISATEVLSLWQQ